VTRRDADPPGALALTDAQRHSIGVVLSQIEELMADARRHGAPDEALGHLARVVEEVRASSSAIPPLPPRNVLNATIAQMRVLAEGLRPQRLRGYGPLDEATAGAVDRSVERLEAAVVALYPHRLRQPSAGGSAD
jgi:hypothetical protein